VSRSPAASAAPIAGALFAVEVIIGDFLGAMTGGVLGSAVHALFPAHTDSGAYALVEL
jgi:H+/Cl- antiporter ClcA